MLRKYHPRIVGVTGNVGKTSAKDMIAAVLSTGFTVRKSAKSYNSELGLPLAILNLKSGWDSPLAWADNVLRGFSQVFFRQNYPEWLVLELGVDHPGDMERAVAWLPLNIAILTGMSNPPVHVEYFGKPEALYAEKAKIFRGLRTGGTVIANFDDTITMGLVENIGHHLIAYGMHKGAGICANNVHFLYREKDQRIPDGLTFKLEYQGKSLPVRLRGVVGKNMVYAALAAIAVGMTQKLNAVEMIAALAIVERPRGRLRLLRGLRDTLVLDDTYNSSPAACKLALETFRELETAKRHIAVLGDMLELGTYTESAHRDVGEEAAGIADLLVVVGPRARMIGEGALDVGFPYEKLIRYEDSRTAALKISELIQPEDIILVKGSQGMRMELVVKALLADPTRASELLVRQEKAWQNR